MNVETLRFADRCLGLPLCWLLTIVRVVAKPFARRAARPKPRNVLIIKLSEMGSTVLACPAFRELEKRFGCDLYFIAFIENSAIFRELQIAPEPHTIIVDTRSAWKLIRSGLNAIRTLRRIGIDTTIDMDFFSRFAAVLAYLVCRGNRVGFAGFTDEGHGRGSLLTHPVMYSPHIHTSEAFMALVHALEPGYSGEILFKGSVRDADYSLPEFKPSEEALTSVREKLTKHGIRESEHRLVLVNPNSSDIFPLRKWPLTHFSSFCATLLNENNSLYIAITGSSSERAQAERMAREIDHGRCFSLAGCTTFAELLALYACADLMLTNDSGPAHFAGLLSLPRIVLFGPETPRLYRPIGGDVRCMYSNFACSPCVSVYNAKKSACQNNRCLQVITVEDVLSEARDMLGG
jgi:ADP-heptose:LPS heptosyltransferase